MARGSQKCSGTWALLARAPTAISAPARVTTLPPWARSSSAGIEDVPNSARSTRSPISSSTADTPVTSSAISADRRASRCWPVVADEQVRRDRGQVPEDEQQQEILGGGQPDHGHHEQRHQRVEAAPLGLGPLLVLQM